jgi:superfamily II DNA or RNA helicase
MVKIELGNHRSRIRADLELLTDIQEDFKLKAPGYFYSPAWRSRQWDGKVKYISDAGYFSTGLIEEVLEWLRTKADDQEVRVIDTREFDYHPEPLDKVNRFELRGYQFETLVLTLSNEIHGIPFYRGVWNLATNAGKNLVSAGLFESFGREIPTLFLVNRKHIYDQAKKELGELFPTKLGYCGPDGVKWKTFNIAMAQTLSKRIKKYGPLLSKIDMVIVDECHYAASNTYKSILSKIDNASVRIGMSGTAFKHKDPNKNRIIKSYFGPEIKAISNDELIKLGFSTPPIVTILDGADILPVKLDFRSEESQCIVNNVERNKKVIKRVRFHLNRGRDNIIVFCKYVEHVEKLAKRIKKKFPDHNVGRLHTKVKDKERKQILEDFKSGKISVLVSGYLLKEGQNLPLIKALINAGGSDSMITVLQIVGRALRTHDSKTKVYIDDFFDNGHYIKKHSKHRLKEYKSQNFKVIEKHSIKR